MFQKILLCSDGSDSAMRAAPVAAELAGKFGAELLMLCVFDEHGPLPTTRGEPNSELAQERSIEEVQEAAERRTGKALDALGCRYESLRELGHPAEKIVAVADRERADLIVMGSRGLSHWKALLLGSVSDAVLHHAHCSVLIVR